MIAITIAIIKAAKVMKQLKIEGVDIQHPIGMFLSNLYAFWLPLEAKVLGIAALILIPLAIIVAILGAIL